MDCSYRLHQISGCCVEVCFSMGTSWSSSGCAQNFYDQWAAEQIALENVLFEHKRALQLADSRKLVSSECVIAFFTVSLMLVSQKIKQPYLFVVPVVPLVIGLLYNLDQQRDVTIDAIKERARQFHNENPHLFEPVGGPVTLAELDRRIMQLKYQTEKFSE